MAALAASELPVQEEEDGAQAVEPAEKKKKKKKKQAEDSEMAEAAGELCVCSSPHHVVKLSVWFEPK